VARVVLARRARGELLELNWPLIDAMQDALGVLEREPLAGHPLRGRLIGLRSHRVGTYRIIYQLADTERTVRVVAIRHRSIAYRSDPRQPKSVGDAHISVGLRLGPTLRIECLPDGRVEKVGCDEVI
jgi:mRNA-degrading endonuclease RelE of RelBE toxin-antitoxin system